MKLKTAKVESLFWFKRLVALQRFYLLWCVFLLSGLPIIAQTSNDPQILQPNQTLEREITGLQTHRYKFDLQANEFFQVRVEQKGIDISLRLTDTGGKTLATMDSPNGKEGFETLSFVAETNGSYFLEIIPPSAKAEKETYIISRTASRTATDKDRRRVEVERVFVEAIKARFIEGQEETAITKLESALKGWQDLEDSYLVDLTNKNLTQFKENKYFATLSRLFSELQKANDVLDEGARLALKSKADSIAAREKLNEALAIHRALLNKVNDKELVEKIRQSGEVSKKPLDLLRNLQYYVKFGETSCLNMIAQTYDNLSDWQNYVDYKKLVLAGYRTVITDKNLAAVISPQNLFQIKLLEAMALKETGESLADYLGKIEEGLDYLSRSLESSRVLYQETQNLQAKLWEAKVSAKIAYIYGKQSRNNSKSIEFHTKSLEIYRTIPGKKNEEAETLTLIALRYMLNFQYEEARKNFDNALRIFQDTDNKWAQSNVLQSLAKMSDVLNNKSETVKYSNQNLLLLQSADYNENYLKNFAKNYSGAEGFEIYQEKNRQFIEYQRLGSIGLSYRLLENYLESLVFYEKTLAVARECRDLIEIKLSLFDVGYTLGKLEKWNEAADYYLQELEASREIGNAEDIATSLQDVGGAFLELGKPQEALKYQSEALLFYQSVGIVENQTFTPGYSSLLSEISRTHYALGNKQLAILYGKRAVNATQGERQRLHNLDSISQKGFLEKKEKHYRRLAEWLVESGRLVEAEQVLTMLKQEEVADYLRREPSFAEKVNLRIDFTATEKTAIEGYQKNAETLSTIGAEFSKIETLKRSGVKLSDEQEKQFEELSGKLKTANTDFQNFLNNLSETFQKGKDSGLKVSTNQNIQGRLANWGEGISYIYTVVGENLNVVLHTSDVNVSKKSDGEITAAALNKKIFAFREAVKNPKTDPRPLGKELYDVLIKPFEAELDASKTKTILWSLDGNLRLLPLAALWDGKQYLGQKYQNVLITQAGLFDLEKEVSAAPNVLALGVSDAKTVPETLTERKFSFNALPSVSFELDSIVQTTKSPKGVLPGESFLNDGFTRKSFAEQLLKKYKIVHIASHFSMNAGDASRSFLLLGDGNILTVSDLTIDPSFKQKFQGVELLTLSACDTAVGETDSNGKEVEGFAYVAQQNGARAILATLWSVADTSTALLMSEFYRLRKENPQLTKAEAIQKAQLRLLNGNYKPGESPAQRGTEIVTSNGSQSSAFKTDANAPFAHPYYWSPFVLIGNWR